MDTKLIQQYGEEIRCYRLRTARQRKRMRYKDHDKQLIQWHKKENELYLRKRNLGWEPLHPPVQKGWIRYFVLRDDVARSSLAVFFEGILKKINTRNYYWKKDFKRKKKVRGRKIYVVKPQYLLKPCEYEFLNMKFTENEKHFFREFRELDWKKQPVKRYEFTEPWRFVLKTSPNMIDKVRIRDPLLESEIKELDNYLESNDLRKRLDKILRGYYKYRYWRPAEKYNEVNEFKDKSLIQILDLIKHSKR